MPKSTLRPCWWCGAPADSREHKFKKTDVARASKTWAIDDKPFYVGENVWKPIQGPNSKLVKFDKVLCEVCNTKRSQPFDRAYDAFVAWVRQRGVELMRDDVINFTEVYGAVHSDEVLNLLKYFAKHLGCRIASNDIVVPPAFVAMLDSSAMPQFYVTLSRNAEIKGIPIRGGDALHNFPFLARYSPSSGDVRPPYQYGCIVGYLDVIYRYRDENRFEWEGEPIDPSRRVTKLGLYMAGAPHPSYDQLAGSAGDKKIEIGGYKF